MYILTLFPSDALRLHRISPLHSQRCRSATMVKDKTAALERAKKATGAAEGKKTN